MFGDKLILILSSLFGAFLLYKAVSSYKSKKPVRFFISMIAKVNPSNFKNPDKIPAYNKEVGHGWLIFSLCFFATGLIGYFYDGKLAGTLTQLLCTLGLALLVFNYRRIAGKYLKQDTDDFTENNIRKY